VKLPAEAAVDLKLPAPAEAAVDLQVPARGRRGRRAPAGVPGAAPRPGSGRMIPGPPPWVAWAPPLDPPTPGGLDLGEAEAIALAYWHDDPHLAAALMWEHYAATLPPAPPYPR
jgi:hypothetical protein